MGNYLNIGNAGFAAARKGTYVDKTGMISFINSTLGTADKLTCVSRPRRFGKSFAAKMLCAYYDKSCDSRELFEGLEISRNPSFEKHLNSYNVIYLDITLFISCAADIRTVVQNIKDAVMEEVTEAFPDIPKGEDLSETMVRTAKASGERFIMIIDEWDALFREAKDDSKLQKEYISFLRSLFKSSWTDVIFEAAYITGILPIKKFGTQSAMTDFREYTMLAPRKLAEYVGFTEPEVRGLCHRYGMEFEEVRRWYDGYSFHRVKSVYNPNSVMEAAKNEEIANYWIQIFRNTTRSIPFTTIARTGWRYSRSCCRTRIRRESWRMSKIFVTIWEKEYAADSGSYSLTANSSVTSSLSENDMAEDVQKQQTSLPVCVNESSRNRLTYDAHPSQSGLHPVPYG